MDVTGFGNNNYRYKTKPKNYKWYYSDRRTRRYDQNEFLGFRPEHSSCNRHDQNFHQNNSWRRGGLHRYNGNRVYNNQSIQERSTFEWMKQYESMLWDTYEDVKLDSYGQNGTTNNNNLRFYSNLKSHKINEDINDGTNNNANNNISYEIPEEIIVQQKKLLESRRKNACIRCLKIHPQEQCRKLRCRICSSRFHYPKDCPWRTNSDDSIKLCESCNGGNYYLNSRLDFSAYRRLVCSNHNNNHGNIASETTKNTDINPCIKKGYEESILIIGDKDSTQKIKDLDIECYNCSGTGHIICKNEVPFKDVVKKAYCALCGNIGHNYQLCNKFRKVKSNENISGYQNLENDECYYSNEDEEDNSEEDDEDGESDEDEEEDEENSEEDGEEDEGNSEDDEEGGEENGEEHGEDDKNDDSEESCYENENLEEDEDYDQEEEDTVDDGDKDNEDEAIEHANTNSLKLTISGSRDSEILTNILKRTKKEQLEERINVSKSIDKGLSYCEYYNNVTASSVSEMDTKHHLNQNNKTFYTRKVKSQFKSKLNPFHKFQRARSSFKNNSLFKLMCVNNGNIKNESKIKSMFVRNKNIHKSKKKSRRSTSRSRRKK